MGFKRIPNLYPNVNLNGFKIHMIDHMAGRVCGHFDGGLAVKLMKLIEACLFFAVQYWKGWSAERLLYSGLYSLLTQECQSGSCHVCPASRGEAVYTFGSWPSDHYFCSVCLFVCLSVCLFVQSFSEPSLIRFRSN